MTNLKTTFPTYKYKQEPTQLTTHQEWVFHTEANKRQRPDCPTDKVLKLYLHPSILRVIESSIVGDRRPSQRRLKLKLLPGLLQRRQLCHLLLGLLERIWSRLWLLTWIDWRNRTTLMKWRNMINSRIE